MLKKLKKNKIKKKKIIQNLFAILIIMIILIFIFNIIYAELLIKSKIKKTGSSKLNAEHFKNSINSKIYSSENNQIYNIGLKDTEDIKYNELSHSLVDAFIATEDSRFFKHKGFDIFRIIKAVIKNIFTIFKIKKLTFNKSGGSTITMQLVKNSFFTYENHITNEYKKPKTKGLLGINRKIQEIYIANKIERNKILSKKEILELYLNTINFGVGSNIIGIENSSKTYFGKSAKDLTLIESAFMAGVINAPNVNSPYKNIENAKKCTKKVLKLMLKHGYISQKQYYLSSKILLDNIFIEKKNIENIYKNQAYIDVVMNEIELLTEKKTGIKLNPLLTPMKIYTALDEKIQKEIDDIQNRKISYLNQKKNINIQIGSVIIRNKTGEIIGILGGYDYNGKLIHNRASNSKNQPGSTIKPILSYALAFEHLGWATSHTVIDEPFTYPGTNKKVNNYDNRFLGEITLMKAVGDSRNIPALKTLQALIEKVGKKKIIEYLNSLGFKIDSNKFSLGYGIGGAEMLCTPIELAGAYASIYNGGEYNLPHTIKKIEILDKKQIIFNDYPPIRVISEGSAFLTTELMREVVDGRYASATKPLIRNYPVFAKTGTTSYGEEGSKYGAFKGAVKDQLMVTGTSEYSIATWTGFDQKDPKIKPYFTSSETSFNLCGKINGFFLTLLEKIFGIPNKINQPAEIVKIAHIKNIFPYKSPTYENTKDQIVFGLIKKKFLNLISYNNNHNNKKYEIKEIKDFNIIIENKTTNETQNNAKLKFQIPEYKNENSNFEENKNEKILYKIEIYDEKDKIIKSEISNKNEIIIFLNFNKIEENSTNNLKACVFYIDENNQNTKKSNIKCKKINIFND